MKTEQRWYPVWVLDREKGPQVIVGVYKSAERAVDGIVQREKAAGRPVPQDLIWNQFGDAWSLSNTVCRVVNGRMYMITEEGL